MEMLRPRVRFDPLKLYSYNATRRGLTTFTLGVSRGCTGLRVGTFSWILEVLWLPQ